MDITERRRALITQLAAARMEKGMTQAQLARAIGTQRSNICRLESGSQNLTLDMFFKIADALGKEPSILLSDREENMESIYLLKIFDTPLVRFGLTDSGLEGLRARIIDVYEDHKHLFPLNLTLNDEGILRLRERTAKRRMNRSSNKHIKFCEVSYHDETIEICHFFGFSLQKRDVCINRRSHETDFIPRGRGRSFVCHPLRGFQQRLQRIAGACAGVSAKSAGTCGIRCLRKS